MNRFVTYFALLATLLPLIACGESSDYGANANQQKETTSKSKNCVTNADCFEETWDFYQNPGNVTSISQGEAFPTCGGKNQKQLLFVTCSDNFESYLCEGSKWRRVSTTGPSCPSKKVEPDTVMQSEVKDEAIASYVDFENKFFVDARDSQTYKITIIGDQIWMAQDLNFKVENSDCYEGRDGENKECVKQGRGYTWAAAVGKTESECGPGKRCNSFDKRGICPAGWHLPSKAEWEMLISFVGGDSIAGRMLKSVEGWRISATVGGWGGGVDAFGFNALPQDYFRTFYWSTTPSTPNYNAEDYAVSLHGETDRMGLFTSSRDSKNSIRCLMDKSALEMNVSYSSSLILSSSSKSSSSSESLKSSSSQIIESSSSSNRSSSSSARLSSGVTIQSSSSKNAGLVEESLVDSRDGQTYRTIVIGSQTWMAENLNFKTDSSFCYNNSADFCEKYGRLYIWESAKSACPSGWRLPSREEWLILFKAVGGQSTAGTKLKSTSGWNNGEKSVNGTDDFGFSALPAGGRYDKGKCYVEGDQATFWSLTDGGSVDVYVMDLSYREGGAELRYQYKGYGFSVRCLKDDALEAKSSSSSSNHSSSSSAGLSSGGVPGWNFGAS